MKIPRPRMDTPGERLWWMVTTIVGLAIIGSLIATYH